MNIEYRDGIDGIDWHQVSDLFQLVGWGLRKPDNIRKAFAASSHVRFALSDSRLVGFGRTVDDGEYYALIVDLVVHPRHQNLGIGSKILAELRDQLESYSFTTLTAAAGKDTFYLKQGWEKQTTAFIWPRSEQQRSEHAEPR